MTFNKLTIAYRACRVLAAMVILFILIFSAPVEAKRHHHKSYRYNPAAHKSTYYRHYRRYVASHYTPPTAGFVMDADTGQVLYQSNADQPLHPASLTKIMTLLMVFEAIERGQLSLNDRISISSRAASMAPSKLGLRAGSTITVRDAIYTVVTKSCNDIAVALAEALGGTESAFSQSMTVRARQLGLSHTAFADASGLPNPNQWSSARDMANLARYVIATYPAYYRFYSTKNYYYGGQVLHNHNRLMNSYAGMDGVKSGYVDASGFNLVASAVRDNHRLIGVVFGGKTANQRNVQMAALLDASFEKLKKQAPVTQHSSLSVGSGFY